MSAASSRIAVLQVLRALAALSVAQAHVIVVVVYYKIHAFQATFAHFETFGAVGVDIFFVVSGFIVPLTARSPSLTCGQFALRRIVRIYPIWWFALLVWFLVPQLHGAGWSWRLLWHSALLLPSLDKNYLLAIGIGWSLVFEMFFYLLIVLTWRGPASTRPRRVLIVAGTLGVIGSALAPNYPMSHIITNPMLLEFSGGVIIGLLWTSGRMPSRRTGTALLSLGVALLLGSGYFGFGEIADMKHIINGQLSLIRVIRWGIPSAMIVAGALSLAPLCDSLPGRIMVALGDASYSIYLTSFFTESLLSWEWRHLLAWMPGDLAILVSLALVVAVGFSAYRFVELPVLNALKPLTRRRVHTMQADVVASNA